VAKLASGRAKPDGLLVVPVDQTVTFLHRLPVGALWGVGERTEATLQRLGLRTVADLAHTPVETLERALGPAAGHHLHDLSWGRDERHVVPEQAEKSIGAEETFARDVGRSSGRVARAAAAVGAGGGSGPGRECVGRTVVLKVRFADFTTITRSAPQRAHRRRAGHPHHRARPVHRSRSRPGRLRLVGVRLEGLTDAAAGHHQLTFGEKEHGWRDAERAVDAATARFGAGSVRPASLVSDPDEDFGSRTRGLGFATGQAELS